MLYAYIEIVQNYPP